MEPKKNPKYDVHQKRGVLLNVGLIVSLIIVITAFKWTVPVRRVTASHRFDNAFQDAVILDNPRTTTFKKIEIPKAKQIKISVPLAFDFKEVKDVSGPEK